MPIIKTVNEDNHVSYDTEDSIINLIEYIFNCCKTSCDDVRPGNIIGDFVGCSCFMGSLTQEIDPEMVALQMIVNNRIYGKFTGNLIKHRIISFARGEYVLPYEVLQLAHKIADAYGENYITAYAVHLDTRNIHVHLAIDTISWRDGHRFSVSHELKWLRAIIEGWQKEMDDTIRTNQSFDRNLRYYGEY